MAKQSTESVKRHGNEKHGQKIRKRKTDDQTQREGMDPTGAEKAVDEEDKERVKKVDGVAVPMDRLQNFRCVAVRRCISIGKREGGENRVDAVEYVKHLQPRSLIDGSAV